MPVQFASFRFKFDRGKFQAMGLNAKFFTHIVVFKTMRSWSE